MLNYQPDTAERAWAAGFFDGEGCSYIHRASWPAAGGVRKRMYPHIQINQVDDGEKILTRLNKSLGSLGFVSGPYERKKTKLENCRPYWALNIRGFGPMQTALGIMWPYLSDMKKAQATRVLKECALNFQEQGLTQSGTTGKFRGRAKTKELN